MLKCTIFGFGWGSAPDPAGGAYSDPSDPLAGFGVASRQGRGWAGEEKGKGREGKWRGWFGKGRPQVTVEPGPLIALLRHWSSVQH